MSIVLDKKPEVLQFLRTQLLENGYPPTFRDIASALDIKSTSTVQKIMDMLEEEGYIRMQNGKRRAFELLENGEPIRRTLCERTDVIAIPIVGRVAAGMPILSEQNIEGTFPIPSAYITGRNTFMLTVHGDSMIEAGIFDGDSILVQEQETANNGDIVVAMIHGEYDCESTVKTFYKENDHIRLQPQNSAMDPIIVDTCEILGIVKGVFRYFH